MTAAEVEAIKGEKTLLGGLKGVTHKEFEAVKRTAVAVESMTAERDQALARAERADLQPPPPKRKKQPMRTQTVSFKRKSERWNRTDRA